MNRASSGAAVGMDPHVGRSECLPLDCDTLRNQADNPEAGFESCTPC